LRVAVADGRAERVQFDEHVRGQGELPRQVAPVARAKRQQRATGQREGVGRGRVDGSGEHAAEVAHVDGCGAVLVRRARPGEGGGGGRAQGEGEGERGGEEARA